MKNSSITRRDFLRGAALTGAGLLIGACAPAAPQAAAPPAAAPKAAAPAAGAAPAAEKYAAGTKLTGIMRNNFVLAMNTLQTNQGKQWGDMRGVTVDLSYPNDYREKAAAAAESGAGADIYELFQNNAIVYAEKLEDMSEICEAIGKRYGGWYDVAKQAALVNGVWRGIPRSYTAHTVNYRVDFFQKAGIDKIPTTYDELLQAGRKLKQAGQPLLGFPVSQASPNDGANWTYSILWSFGGKEVEKDGKTVAINSKETKAALDYVKALAEVSVPDITSYDDAANNRSFLAGQIAATNNASSIYVTATQQAPDVAKNMDHFPYPSGPAGHKQFVEVNVIGVFSAAPQKKAAKEFLTWLMEEAQLSPFFQLGQSFAAPQVPYFEDLPNMPWNLEPKFKAFKGTGREGLLPGWPGPASRASGEAFNKQIVINMFARHLAGQSADATIAQAEKELKTVYGG